MTDPTPDAPLCANCHRRPGTNRWNSHGCMLCAVRSGLAYANQQAAMIPELEAALAKEIANAE
jgi:hypothetical protein